MWPTIFRSKPTQDVKEIDMRTSVPATGARSPFSHLARLGKKADDEKENDSGVDDNGADDEDDEDEEGDSDEEKKQKAKKRAKKKAEDEEDEDDEDKPEARAVRLRERARIRTIINCRAAQRSPAAARHLALHTKTPRHAAVKMLAALTADLPKGASRDSLRDRMAREGSPDIGPNDAGPPTGSHATAAAIIAAGKKRRGEI
jgi:hypothetical protein